ncbi:hypothetical protein FH972_012560 [Carpinus fangiana]|uniref:Major facilitator superfamily associated domain-containing protein n=1 Tax=Carpinus fangiana TaxID=176857 RepID=A0A5N6R7B7_9ROSI|nr:hypothetical protein FH972_012560 [Carpinus fangiana]
MAELTPDIETVPESKSSPSLSGPLGNGDGMATPDVQSAAMKMERAKEAYNGYAGNEEKPASVEVWSWYLYEFCSYFIQSVLMPIVFPLIMSQIASRPPEPENGASFNSRGLLCRNKEIILYQRLTQRSIPANNSKLSPIEWTSICWAIGLLIVAPILGPISFHLDHGRKQPLLAATAIGIGVIFCLPVGFFKTPWTFLPYITAIVAAHTIASTCHTRHLGLMVRGFTGPFLRERQFPIRRAISGWLSVYATTAGCMGSATIAAFAFYMLREAPNQEFISLWVVSIFSGLQWLVGILHVFTGANRTCETIISASPSKLHAFSIFKYPHAIVSLAGVFLSSFTTMCVFTGGVLFLVGNLCLKPPFLLYIWLIYFIFPMFSLPLLQHLIKADAVKMQLLGFLLLTTTTGTGFYFKEKNWEYRFVLFFAAVHSTSTGLLHAFGRVLFLDCSPSGKEGAFSIWYSWVKALGTFMGFAVVSIAPGKIATSFGITFWTAMVGIVLLNFGNISDFGGALAAKNVGDDSERRSPVRGMDTGVLLQNREFAEGETP